MTSGERCGAGKTVLTCIRATRCRARAIYDGFPWLTAATWSFSVETGTHALRLMTTGLSNRHPQLQMILATSASSFPQHLRIDNIMRGPARCACQAPVGEYLRENVYITTSGISARRRCLRDACSKWARTASCIQSTIVRDHEMVALVRQLRDQRERPSEDRRETRARVRPRALAARLGRDKRLKQSADAALSISRIPIGR